MNQFKVPIFFETKLNIKIAGETHSVAYRSTELN